MELLLFLAGLPLLIQAPLGILVLYVLGAILFVLTARLERLPNGCLVVDHQSWHFKTAHTLFMYKEGGAVYKDLLQDARGMKIGICGYYFRLFVGCMLISFLGCVLVVGYLILFVINIVSIPIFGGTARLSKSKDGIIPIFKSFMPRIWRFRVWPIAYIALATLVYYWNSIFEPVTGAVTSLVTNSLFIEVIIWVSVALAIVVVLATIINAFRKSNQALLVTEWIKAKKSKICPLIEVK